MCSYSVRVGFSKKKFDMMQDVVERLEKELEELDRVAEISQSTISHTRILFGKNRSGVVMPVSKERHEKVGFILQEFRQFDSFLPITFAANN